MWEKIKEKLWVFLVAIAALIGALLSKPKWERKKVKEIKERDKEIKREKENAHDVWEEYKEAKEKHDEKIEEIKDKKEDYVEPVPFDNPDDAADFLRTLYAESPNLDDLFTPENIILLANHIQELEARNVYLEKENQRLELENKQLEAALVKKGSWLFA